MEKKFIEIKFNFMKRLFTSLLFVCFTSLFFAQNNGTSITGTVVDATTREALPGALVKQVGTNNGTNTDLDGKFSIQLKEGDKQLEISFLGYETQEIDVAKSTVVHIEMQESSMELEQVVVTGYATQKKVNLTGAVESITGDNLASKPVISASMALQGVAPGVTVTQASGRPGADGGTIRIRGIGTMNNSNPLILVDGRQGSLDGLDANDIESVSVLKDAASAAIYGSRAANGVILVTTKRGVKGKVTVTYNAYVGKQEFTDQPEYVDGYTHMVKNNIAVENTGRSPLYDAENYIPKYQENKGLYSYEYPDVDWQKIMYKGSGLQQHHHIGISGGNEYLSTMANLSFMDQKGLVKNFDVKRYSVRVNNDIKAASWLQFKVDLYGRFTPMDQPTVGENEVFQLQRYNPTMAVYLPDGRYSTNSLNYPNLKAMLDEGGTNSVDYMGLSGTLSAIITPIKGMTLVANYMPDYGQSRGSRFAKPVAIYRPDSDDPALYNPSKSTLTESFSRNFTNNFNVVATYDFSLNKHGVTVLGGYEQIDYTTNYFNAYRENFTFIDYPVLNAGDKNNMTNNGSGEEWALKSYFGRINYNYDGKYLFEANIRRDGSSRFLGDNRYGSFPSFSAAWNINQENFMKNISWLDQLKLRASWGKLGNQDIQGNYPFASVHSLGLNYVLNGEPVSGMALTDMANEKLTWETTTSTNFGVDFYLFRKFSGSFDIYKRVTDDILLKLPISNIIGLDAPYQNAAKVENKGWELSLSYRDNIGDFKYSARFSLSDVKNKVVDLKGTGPYISRFTVIKEGEPINALYMYKADGLFQNEDQISEHASQIGTLAPGDIRYVDQLTIDSDGDGILDASDGKITADDRVVVGSNIPRYTYGIDLSAEYKGFDLSVLLQGVGKRDTYLDGSNSFAFFNMGQMQKWHLDYWTEDNPNAKYPRLIDGSSHNNFEVSDYWKSDASYLRVKTINIGYTIPATLSRKMGLSRIRIYASGNNLFTFDSLPKGFDPEYPMGNGFSYPITASYVFGLNLSF